MDVRVRPPLRAPNFSFLLLFLLLFRRGASFTFIMTPFFLQGMTRWKEICFRKRKPEDLL